MRLKEVLRMGLLDSITSMAGQFGGGGDKAKVTGGLMDALQQHPGGIGGVLSSFQQNGMGNQVQQWAGGQTQQASPEQIQQGLGGTGIIDNIAQRTGMSPEVVKMGLAAVIPLVIQHFVSSGHVTPQGQVNPTAAAPTPEEHGGMLSSILARLG